MIRRIAIAAGGTAGHVTAGLAVAEAYRAACEDVSVCFIGTPAGLEGRLVPPAGHSLELVRGTPMAGASAAARARAACELALGAAQARRVLARHRARLAIGFGGYASAGAVLAARSLGLGVAIHESNVVPGLANRLLARIADRVYLGFDAARATLGHRDARTTGNPVRPEIAAAAAAKRSRGDAGGGPARVLVLGGSLGSSFLNGRAPDLLWRVARRGLALDVRHQTGAPEPGEVARAYRARGLPAVVQPFFADMAEAYAWADFAISAAGALTLAELAEAGLPALLVPLRDSAGDHQLANARAFAEATGGWYATEAAWEPEPLAERIASLLRGVEDWASASKRMRQVARPGAALEIVAGCEELMTGRW